MAGTRHDPALPTRRGVGCPVQRGGRSGERKPTDRSWFVIHSGGHAHPEDLANLARRLHPRAVVPIHTEAASQFSDLIQNVRIIVDGEAVNVASLIAGDNGKAT